MTAINAIRFDDKSGLLICDEQRTWNDEEMKVDSCDKMRPIVTAEVVDGTGLAVCYGNTGSSSLGDEWCVNMTKGLTQKYEAWKDTKNPSQFLSIEQVAEFAFKEQTKLKHDHIDQQLKGKFGFTANDFIKGSYEKDGKTIPIKDKKVVERIPEFLTWSGRSKDVTGVFLNAGIIAGYSPVDGFRIFLLSLIDPTCEPVGEIYLAEGSGLDICDHLFTDFANGRSMPERRKSIDRSLATLNLLEGLNYAIDLCAGVGGYIKMIYVNGHEKDHSKRIKEIADGRAKLGGEIAEAYTRRFLDEKIARKLIEELIYLDRPFWDVNEELMKTVRDRDVFVKHLRGYTT